MAKKIQEFQIKSKLQNITVEFNSTILSIQLQRGVPFMYMIVDTMQELVTRTFVFVKTGEKIPEGYIQYHGTFETSELWAGFDFKNNEILKEWCVYHCFELLSSQV